MIQWRSPGSTFVTPGPIGGPPRRDEFDPSYDTYGHHHPPEPYGHVHGLSNHPYGMEHLFAKNERPPLVGWGYVGVFDQKPARGEMIAGRIRQELDRPLARRIKDFFRIKVVPREATVSDVRSLRDHDAVVAVLGKGGEATAMTLFEATVEHFQKSFDAAAAKVETKTRFSVLGGGITVSRVAVVPVTAASPFGGDETLIGNIAVHEFGHAISSLGIRRDHDTGGVMQKTIGIDDPDLHFTAGFLKQF
jgi:hypothetical protein